MPWDPLASDRHPGHHPHPDPSSSFSWLCRAFFWAPCGACHPVLSHWDWLGHLQEKSLNSNAIETHISVQLHLTDCNRYIPEPESNDDDSSLVLGSPQPFFGGLYSSLSKSSSSLYVYSLAFNRYLPEMQSRYHNSSSTCTVINQYMY